MIAIEHTSAKPNAEKEYQRQRQPRRQRKSRDAYTEHDRTAENKPAFSSEVAEISDQQRAEKRSAPGRAHHQRQPCFAKMKDIARVDRHEREVRRAK